MYGSLAFQPSQYSGLHYGAPPAEGYPCIKKGATDELSDGAVTAVQNALVNVGIAFSLADFQSGTFGPATDASVRKFQADNKFDVDGIVGPITGKKLGLKFQSCTSVIQTSGAPIDPGGGPPGLGEWFTIQRLTNPGLFYGGIAMTGLILFAGTAIYLNERNR